MSNEVVFSCDPFLRVGAAILRTQVYILNGWKGLSVTGCHVAGKIFPKGKPPVMKVTIGEFAFEGSIMLFPVFAREVKLASA